MQYRITTPGSMPCVVYMSYPPLPLMFTPLPLRVYAPTPPLLSQDNDGYPQLDVDDVLKIDEELRRQRLRDLLQTAKEPVEASIWGSV